MLPIKFIKTELTYITRPNLIITQSLVPFTHHSRLTLSPPSTEKETSLRTARPASVYFTLSPRTSIWPRLGQQSWAWGLSMTRSGRPLPPGFPGSGSSDGRSMNLKTRSTERIWVRVRTAVGHWELATLNKGKGIFWNLPTLFIVSSSSESSKSVILNIWDELSVARCLFLLLRVTFCWVCEGWTVFVS